MALRFLTGDDPVQSPIARVVMADEFALPISVVLEIEWVLRSWYKWTRPMIAQGLRLLVDLPALEEVPQNVFWAIDRYEAGADFADMIHIAGTVHATVFATFDGDIARAAGLDSPLPIETLV